MNISKNLGSDDSRLVFEISNWDDFPRKFTVAITRNDQKPEPAFKQFGDTEVTLADIARLLPNVATLRWDRSKKIDKQVSAAKDENYTVMLYFPPKEQWWEPDAMEEFFVDQVSGR